LGRCKAFSEAKLWNDEAPSEILSWIILEKANMTWLTSKETALETELLNLAVTQ